jgi:hypothetical protein
MIGAAIRDGSRYLPIRHRAARLASRAGHKDYLGQVREIYKDFLKRWRYVRDPIGRELVVTDPERVYQMVMGGDGQGRGAGDCDCVSVAIGAQLAAIGLPVRVCVIAPPGAPAGPIFTHVFVQGQVPGHGWVTVDPVLHPHKPFGAFPPASRFACFDLTGVLMEQKGNTRGLYGRDEEGENQMYGFGAFDVNDPRWVDYAGFGDYAASTPDRDLPDFRVYGIKDFGAYAEHLGMMGGCGLAAEVDENDEDGLGRAWAPMIELAPHDYAYLQRRGEAYDGMKGVGDNGDVYEFDGSLGFFKKLFKRIKKGAKKVLSKAKGFAKKLIKKIPGGKYLLKLGSKIWKVAKKLVKPLVKFVGKYASKLAPVAALIPGWGPAIAAGLHTAGKIARRMQQFGVKLATPKGGGLSKLKFPSGKAAKAFKQAIKKDAKKLARKSKKIKSKKRRRISRGIAPPPKRRSRRTSRRIARTSRRVPSWSRARARAY